MARNTNNDYSFFKHTISQINQQHYLNYKKQQRQNASVTTKYQNGNSSTQASNANTVAGADTGTASGSNASANDAPVSTGDLYDLENNTLNSNYRVVSSTTATTHTGGTFDTLPDMADGETIDKILNTSSLPYTTYKDILSSTTINGIFGMPYQFLPDVDIRVGRTVDTGAGTAEVSDFMGRKYAEKIATHLPLLFLTPCRPQFMEGFSQEDQDNILSDLISAGNGNTASAGNLSKSGRYYTTKFAYSEYFSCVNLMCAEVAYFCGIHNERVNTARGAQKKIGEINWMEDFRNDSFNDYFYAKDSVVLYADGLTTVSDSFSNSTTDSQLASTVNGFSDTAKELNFILGENSVLSQLKDAIEKGVESLGESLGSTLINVTAGGMLSDIASTGVSTIMSGGKLLFPKIWGDSTFSRSYSFDIKLRSPDHDSVSIFFNILVPYIHLLALCMPQSITENGSFSANAYNSPFMLRAYSKGQFNINMGMITDMSVTRGGEAQWNDNGLPTQVDISLTIEDLYNTLFMSNPNEKDQILGKTYSGPLDILTNLQTLFNLDIVSNTEMLDFLSNLSGLNIAGQELNRKTKLAQYLTMNSLKRVPSNIHNYFDNGVTNMIRGFFKL